MLNIEGTWYNEHESRMTLWFEDREKGLLSGTYESTTGATGVYRVSGLVDPNPVAPSTTFAFAVQWSSINPEDPPDPSWHWTSGFVGQLQIIDGEETLTTLWMLVQNTDPAKNWESTLVDKSVFKRNPYAK